MRPSSQGPKAVAQDVMTLTRVLRRVETDPKRTPAQRKTLVGHLKSALAILLADERTTLPVK